MLDPAIGVLLAALYALLFATAAVQKLRAPTHFAAVLAAYRLLPEGAARLWLLVPMVEVLVAAGLLVSATRAAAACAGAGLLALYAAAIAVNLKRGRHELACGCGGANESRPIAPWMVVRNLLLAAALPLVMLPWRSRPLAATDACDRGWGHRGRRPHLCQPRPVAVAHHTPGCAPAGDCMNPLVISNIVLWVLVLVLAAVLLAVVRQLGVLHERITPAGALTMLNRGLTVGESGPGARQVTDLAGRGA